jgi:hypothetical protein
MKKLILIILAIPFLASISYASPFLVCDPQTGVTKYEIEVNGTILGQFNAETDGSAKVDLAGYSSGSYSFRLRAMGTDNWWSDFSDPFDATKPGKVGNVRIIP